MSGKIEKISTAAKDQSTTTSNTARDLDDRVFNLETRMKRSDTMFSKVETIEFDTNDKLSEFKKAAEADFSKLRE